MTGQGRQIFMRAAARFLALALLALPLAARAQVCPSCIQNSAAPQNAQVNLGTATVRGTLTASTGTFIWLNATNVSIGNLMGNGASLTNLNAAQLLSGTVPSSAISGHYSGITGVGTLSVGSWAATAIGTQYGGTGQNFATVGAGALPYFSASGTMGTLASPGSTGVLQSQGGGAAPAWTNTPALQGTNFAAIPLTALSAGNLPTSVAVQDGSLSTVSAAKVVGNISGGAATLTTPLPLSNLAGGILSTAVAASSITVTGVAPGTYGGPTQIPQFHVGTDGRLTSVAQFTPPFVSTYGYIPSQVLVPPSQISSGTLPANVVASSIAVTGTQYGAFGGAAKSLSLTVQPDGRLSAVAQQNIALPLTQLNSGTLPSNIFLPAASVQAGTLGNQVVASSIAANGVAPGTYGTYGFLPQITVGGDGRVTAATQLVMPSLSTATATVNRDNGWTAPQTFQSSVTVNSQLRALGNVTGAMIVGDGSLLSNLTAASVSAGSLGPGVIASSIAVQAVGDPQLTTTGVTAGSKGSAARIPTVIVNAQGRVTALTDQVVAVSTGEVSGIVQPNQGGTGNDWSATAAGGVPYFSGTGAMSVLPKSTNGWALELQSGLPAWVASVSSATNLAGAAAGSTPYQTAANTTAFRAAGTNGQVSVMDPTGSFPQWSSYLPETVTISTKNVSPGFNAASELVKMDGAGKYPAADGSALTNLTAANVAAGTLGTSVIASSVAATGVTVGTYGSASQSLTATVGVDGRLSALSANSIAIAASQVTSGQLAIARGGTNLSSAGGTANRVLTTTDGSTFAMGQVIGPMIAGSTIPLNALNQSGASDGQVIAWSNANSQWQATNSGVSGGVANTVPVFTGANSLGAGSGFITNYSSGVAISTNATFGAAGSSITIVGQGIFISSAGAIFMQMQSMDGATQSPGCLVAIKDNGSNSVFTSTTTSSVLTDLGILAQTCAPLSWCWVQTYGRGIITEIGASTDGDEVITSTTRCQGTQVAPPGNSYNMRITKAIGGAGSQPVFIH